MVGLVVAPIARKVPALQEQPASFTSKDAVEAPVTFLWSSCMFQLRVAVSVFHTLKPEKILDVIQDGLDEDAVSPHLQMSIFGW